MGVSGFQQHFMLGSQLLFRRSPISGVAQPWRDIGLLKSCSPKLSEETKQLWEGKTGELELADQRTMKRIEIWEAVCNNLNHDNLSLIFGSPLPTVVAGTTATKLGNVQLGSPGDLLFLCECPTLEDVGERAVNIASIGSIEIVEGDPLIEGTDWEWYDKTMGVIRLLAGGALTLGTPVHLTIDYTLANVDTMLLLPGQGEDTVSGDVEIWLADNDNETRLQRAFKAFMSRDALTLGAEDFNELTLSFAVRSDKTATNKMGTLTQVTGDFPALS